MVLRHLIDDLPQGGAGGQRLALQAAINSVCRAYRLPLPGAPVDPIQLEHELNPEEDLDAP